MTDRTTVLDAKGGVAALAAFFKEPLTSFGVFYPKHYIVITMPSYAAALNANSALRKAGVAEEEALAVTGNSALKFFRELHGRAGVWAELMTQISRFFNTEEAFLDEDIERAQQGAGFLAVHSPTQEDAQRVRDLVSPFEPTAMHWYRVGTVESLI